MRSVYKNWNTPGYIARLPFAVPAAPFASLHLPKWYALYQTSIWIIFQLQLCIKDQRLINNTNVCTHEGSRGQTQKHGRFNFQITWISIASKGQNQAQSVICICCAYFRFLCVTKLGYKNKYKGWDKLQGILLRGVFFFLQSQFQT